MFCQRASQVSPRRATHFSLLRQRKVSKRKATRQSGSLRCASGNLRCSKPPGSCSNSPTAQTVASPDPAVFALLSPAWTGGAGDGGRTSGLPGANCRTVELSNCRTAKCPIGRTSRFPRIQIPELPVFPIPAFKVQAIRNSRRFFDFLGETQLEMPKTAKMPLKYPIWVY